MTIKQLLAMPIGQKIGGFPLTIKTYKKCWEVEKCYWHQVICMDETGEMPVDVKIGAKYNPLRGRCQKFNVVVAEIQEAEYLGKDRKKLIVDQFMIPSGIAEPPSNDEFYGTELPKIVRGKIKCWAMGSLIERGDDLKEVLIQLNTQEMSEIIDSVMEG